MPIRKLFPALTAIALSSQLHAQDASLNIELSSAQDVQGQCRLSFLAQNNIGSDLGALVLEAVIFDASGAVQHLTLLDFQDLPLSKPRVRQFDIAGACASLGNVLINGVHACSGADATTCEDALSLSARGDHSLLG